MNTSWFEKLARKRQNLLDAHAENDIGRGVWQSAVEKYPDPTHFVYELLQNAEDQKATIAEFELTPVGLRFRHNGLPFNEGDVESITGWGNSQKPSLENKIGRFGIGFKSVFIITEQPRLYTFIEDQPFAFSIKELFLPVPQEADLVKCERGWTKFWLPFWSKRERELRDIINTRLVGLGAGTLLFLNHLQEIRWKSGDQSGAFLCERNGGHIELVESRSQNGREILGDSLTYRVFERPVTEPDTDRALSVKIAFRLDETQKCVVPEVQNTFVHVYFPTEQPFPARFLVHAPFLLTDNRANLKQNQPFNKSLMGEIAELVTKALPVLRDENHWNVASLGALPIRSKAAYDEFQPIYDAVVAVFQQQSLIPTADRHFVSTSQVRLAGSAALRDLISPDQLGALESVAHPIYWVHEEISEDRAGTRETYNYIRNALEVPLVDSEAFASRLNGDFLSRQFDEWMLAFYRFLSKQESLWRSSTRGLLRYKPIIRTADNKQVIPFDKTDSARVFLRATDASKDIGRIVAPQFLENEEALDFFKRLGLREPNIRDEVSRTVLPRYVGESQRPDETQYLNDLALIASALASHVSNDAFIQEILDALFVRAVNSVSGQTQMMGPSDEKLYTRTPELELWFRENAQIWFVEEGLETNTHWKQIQNTLKNAKIRAASDAVTIDFQPPFWNGTVIIRANHSDHARGLSGFDPKARIVGLIERMARPDAETSRLIWNLVRTHSHLIKGIVETSTNQNYLSSWRKEEWSTFGLQCHYNAWLPHPTQSGVWCKPADLELADLPHDWDTTSDAARTAALKLGFKRSELQETAEKLGMAAADLDFLRQNKDLVLEFRQFVEQRQALAQDSDLKEKDESRAAEFPERPVRDPVRRAAKLQEAISVAPVRQYEVKDRSVRVSDFSRDEKRQYLRAAYTNPDGQLICQMCLVEMPFKLSNGEAYFEAVTCVALTHESVENHLALCPVCAAKYRHALDEEEKEIAELVAQADLDAQMIEVNVSGNPCTIRFVESHWFDLRTILNGSERP